MVKSELGPVTRRSVRGLARVAHGGEEMLYSSHKQHLQLM
jgi:hypothetical protein